MVKRQPTSSLSWGLIVGTEAYCQAELACHGQRRRTPHNKTLFGEPGHVHVDLSHGIHRCLSVVMDRAESAHGVLLRTLALPGELERIAAGPGRPALRFGLDCGHNRLAAREDQGLWLAARPAKLQDRMEQWLVEGRQLMTSTTRIGIRQGQGLPWRWYLASSRSVSRRGWGDGMPAWHRAWRAERTWLP